MKSIRFVNFIRFLTLSLSLIGFGCHFAQCTLFSIYQSRTKIPSWFTAGHWQYLAWYVSLGLSIVCALAVCTHATCCRRAHILRGDKCLGIVNIVVLVGTVITNTFMSGQEPWTNDIVEFKEPSKGFITYCSLLDDGHDASYPLLFQRCLLVNSTYVASIAVCLSWIILILCACFIKPKKVSLCAMLPNEDNCRTLSGKNHPYVRKPSSSFDKSSLKMKKYTTPIAPHTEKLELPRSYDNHFLNRPYSTLTIPGGYEEGQSRPPSSKFHYYYYS